ncbi:hypothetical protein ABKN59_000296 [Abortiporus biennis]
MVRSAPRLNRLPQRLDYTLIPAPLDLTLPLVDEKAALPAIIVTPSSPSGEKDFAIAFLAPEPKPSLRERLTASMPSLPSFPTRLPSQIRLPQSPFKNDFEQRSSWSFTTRARTLVVFSVLLFIMACHLILHRAITGHPHLQFGIAHDNDMVALQTFVPPSARFVDVPVHPSDVPLPLDASSTPSIAGWFNLHGIWAPAAVPPEERNPHIAVPDSKPESSESS